MILSVVLATYNEEKNIKECLDSIKNIADEIIIVDGQSQDKTPQIAKKFGAKVISVPNKPDDFHANKQIGIDKANGNWILQLDADERVSHKLSQEIKEIIHHKKSPLQKGTGSLPRKGGAKQPGDSKAKNTIFAAYSIPRKNWFIGKFLTKGGAYPDRVIRLFKKGKGNFPHGEIVDTGITTSNVHAQLKVDGKIGQLNHDLIHYGDKSLDRYLSRLNRYTDLEANNLLKLGYTPNSSQFINYMMIKPVYWFFKRYLRHRGYVDGFQGFLFALLSCMHYPVIYLKIWEKSKLS